MIADLTDAICWVTWFIFLCAFCYHLGCTLVDAIIRDLFRGKRK